MSGIGSLAHYAATAVMKRLGNEKVAYVSTNTTANSYSALLAKATDAVILSLPYTSMATLAGYPDLGNTFDVRDLQGGLVARANHLKERQEQVRAVIRATLRSMDALVKNEPEVVAYLQKDFALEPKIAADIYRILRQVVNADGDIEEPVLNSIIDKIRQEAGFAAEIPLDRLVDLSTLREVKAELRRRWSMEIEKHRVLRWLQAISKIPTLLAVAWRSYETSRSNHGCSVGVSYRAVVCAGGYARA